MPLLLEGSCKCGAVAFRVQSSAPCPYQRCYCSICRKAGGAGFAVNLLADARTLEVHDNGSKRYFHAMLEGDGGALHASSAERHFCSACGSPLWLFSPEWPELIHPIASAIDSELPAAPARVHMMLGSKAAWVQPEIGAGDQCYDVYPEQSIEDWHRQRGLWID